MKMVHNLCHCYFIFHYICVVNKLKHLLATNCNTIIADSEPISIVATGFAGTTMEETIAEYFSTPVKSGGGPLAGIEYNDDDDSFLIEFKHSKGKWKALAFLIKCYCFY